MRTLVRSFSILLSLSFVLPALAAPPSNTAVLKPVTDLVFKVRTQKDLSALKNFDSEQQARFVLEGAYDGMTDAQRKEFSSLFQTIFAKIAFPRVRENLKDLLSASYAKPVVKGDRASVDSTLTLAHPMKNEELKLRYVLTKDKTGWKVLDVLVLGNSMLVDVRDNQVRPLLQEKGVEGMLQAMRDKNAELAKVILK
ncbi:MAG: ABC transporter substrate-binding protein [Myxococcales bacterium]